METLEEFVFRIVRRPQYKKIKFSFREETEYDFLKRVHSYYSRKTQEDHINMRILFKALETINILVEPFLGAALPPKSLLCVIADQNHLQKKIETFLDIYFRYKTEELVLSDEEVTFIESSLMSFLPHLKFFCKNILQEKVDHNFLSRFSAILFINGDLLKSKMNAFFVNDFYLSDEYKKLFSKLDQWKQDHVKNDIYFMRPNNVPLMHYFWD
jgi:hypothetical protein